ncbi:HAD family hydrolase [Octadecabacter sp. R77987]|uniref:HAD family hydrolase n=1 Tax=Octadecabacter sp. R77987 TaxID=3093874 RepID=UPI0036727B00
MAQSLDLVIFDCDGVLIDSEGISARVLIDALADLGVVVDLAHFSSHFVGRSFPTVAKTIREAFSVTLPDDFEAQYRARLLDAFGKELTVTQGVCDVLDAIRHPICVATSSSPPRVKWSLELAGLTSYFGGAVFTASEVRNGKPAPDLFLHTAAKMGVEPSRCLVIEDSLPGVNAGLAAGMPVIRYIGGTHLKGRDLADLKTPPQVPVFDNWQQFFHMMPELRRNEG